jgi:hypothetical protein
MPISIEDELASLGLFFLSKKQFHTVNYASRARVFILRDAIKLPLL